MGWNANLFEDAGAFAEVSYQYLAFDGVQYKVVNSEPSGPAVGPHRIEFGGVRTTFGMQFGRKKK